MTTVTKPEPTIAKRAERPIERFLPTADVRERQEALIHAPADVVFEVARNLDVQSLPLVRAIFWLREKLLGATPSPQRRAQGLVAETTALGWGVLADRPGRELVMGAVTQPWLADVTFRAIPPDRFLAFAEPDLVKIAWTLEVVPIEPRLTLFRTETRALATDEGARRKFLRYWRLVGVGVALIRWLMLQAIRREAERRA